MGSRKRQVMNPTMALVPTRPFTFSSLLRSQHLLLFLVLGLLTGTDNVPTLLSQAHFNNRLSFTTAFHTHTTTHCRVNFASSMHNALMIIAVATLEQVPPRVSPPSCGHRVPGRTGGLRKAGGPVEMAHLTSKQTGDINVTVLLPLQPHSRLHSRQSTSINSLHWMDWSAATLLWCRYLRWFGRCLVHWQNAHVCLYQFHPESGRLFRKNSLFPRSARTTSIEENGGK